MIIPPQEDQNPEVGDEEAPGRDGVPEGRKVLRMRTLRRMPIGNTQQFGGAQKWYPPQKYLRAYVFKVQNVSMRVCIYRDSMTVRAYVPGV